VRAVQKYAPQMSGKILDFGCGSKPYEALFTNVSQYIGVDIDNNPGHNHDVLESKIDVFYDGVTLPFVDGEFDGVFSTQVLEHVPNIHRSLAEMNRVMKPGGALLLTLPFCWTEHEVPNDYRRLTVYGIKQVLNECGFETLQIEKLGKFVEVIALLKILYLMDALCVVKKSWGIWNIFIRVCVASYFNVKALIVGRCSKNQNLYTDMAVFAKKCS
jgi:SAM-dependent methyltransferase